MKQRVTKIINQKSCKRLKKDINGLRATVGILLRLIVSSSSKSFSIDVGRRDRFSSTWFPVYRNDRAISGHRINNAESCA